MFDLSFQQMQLILNEIELRTLILTFIDISIVTILIYRSLLVIKGTRAAPMLIGLTIIFALYGAARYLGLATVFWVLEHFLSSIILVVVVIFQEEIRRGLTKFGLHSSFRRAAKDIYDRVVDDVTTVCSHLSERKLGGLIIIQKEIGLEDLIEDSVTIDAALSRKLLYSLFVRDSSLHDGAVLIDGDRIKAAGCILPLSFDPDLDPNLGTRHRAALGLSERSDAVIIVVSEESGRVSLVYDSRIMRNLDSIQLRETMLRIITDTSSTVASEEAGV